MSTLLLERSLVADDSFGLDGTYRQESMLFSERTDTHGRLTLDELITGVWEGLAVRDTVRCPVCTDDSMRPMSAAATGSHAMPADSLAGVCDNCGSRLS